MNKVAVTIAVAILSQDEKPKEGKSRRDARFLRSSDSHRIDPRSTALASDSRKILCILVYEFRNGLFAGESMEQDATKISV